MTAMHPHTIVHTAGRPRRLVLGAKLTKLTAQTVGSGSRSPPLAGRAALEAVEIRWFAACTCGSRDRQALAAAALDLAMLTDATATADLAPKVVEAVRVGS